MDVPRDGRISRDAAQRCPAHSAKLSPSAFSLRDPEVIASPWAYYQALHAHEGVHQDNETGIWIVAGYRQIQDVLRDNDRFSSVVDRPALRPGGMPAEATAILAGTVKITPTLVGADPPVHTRLRPLVNLVFSAERVEKLVPFIQETIDRLIDGFAAQGTCDLVPTFAAPLPLTVIADQLGVAISEIDKIKLWSDAMIQILGLMGDDARLVTCAGLQKEALEFLLAQVRLRREHPSDSILSDLANTKDEAGALLSDAEIASILMQLMVAGNETTTNTIASGVLYLAQDSQLQARLRHGDAKDMRIFVEEILRAEAPVQGHYRKAKVDVQFGDITIPAGAVVHVRYGAGNRDESFFPNAAAIDLSRTNAPQHLSFGGGIHFCVGAMLARKELQIAFRSLLDRLDAIALAVPEVALMRVPSAQHRGLLSLPITFTARS
ncbi:MAG: cytochrome P450 [Caulobacterales bacterium]